MEMNFKLASVKIRSFLVDAAAASVAIAAHLLLYTQNIFVFFGRCINFFFLFNMREDVKVGFDGIGAKGWVVNVLF